MIICLSGIDVQPSISRDFGFPDSRLRQSSFLKNDVCGEFFTVEKGNNGEVDANKLNGNFGSSSEISDECIEPCNNFRKFASSGNERKAVEKDCGNCQYVAPCSFISKYGAIDYGNGRIGIENRDDGKCLHNFRTVVARK